LAGTAAAADVLQLSQSARRRGLAARARSRGAAGLTLAIALGMPSPPTRVAHDSPLPRLARRALTPALLVGALAVGWFGWQRWRAAPTALTYTTAPVTRGAVTRTVTAAGTLSPVVASTVGSQVSGRVAEVLVDYNDRVEAGQVLARLDPTLLTAQLASARARLTAAQAEVARATATSTNARATHQRAAGLVASGAVATAEVDAALAALRVAEAAVAAARAGLVEAKAQVDTARTNLTYATITAPIAGVVVSRSVDPGNTVAASLQAPELFVIAGDLARMELHASVAEADVGQVRDGQTVELRFDAFPDRSFGGVVRQVRNQALTTANVVSYDAVIAVANPDGALRPGMTATATFIVDQARDTLIVPTKALRYRPAAARPARGPAEGSAGAPGPTGAAASSGRAPRAAVWVLRAGAPVAIAVTPGLSDGAVTAVAGDGLQEDDLVITADSRTSGAGARAASTARSSSSSGRPPGPPPMF
jgi:HlyD family secretion protein